MWKIADFGITAQFTSKSARTTKYGRGSDNYLAPELLAEHAVVTRKTDIWGLGCILYELAVGRTAFNGYGRIREFSASGQGLEIPVLPFQKYHSIFVVDIIHELLEPDPARRPSAVELGGKLRTNVDLTVLNNVPRRAFKALNHGPMGSFQKPIEWTTDMNERLVALRRLGGGSAGEVFKVHSSSSKETLTLDP